MKIEVSTSINGLLKKASLDEALDVMGQAGISCLDFPLHVFSRPENSPIKAPDWEQWVTALKDKLDRGGFRVTQAHASWEQAIAQDLQFAEPYEVYARTIRTCQILGCSKLVFHAPLYFFRTPDIESRRRVTDWNIRWFRTMVPLLEDCGVTACLENTFDYRRVRHPEDPPFTYTSAEDMLELMRGIGSDSVRICLDTGHANISGNDPAQMIRAYGSNLAVLHLNDNFGFIQPVYEDLHLFPGHGALKWDQIFRALYETGFRGIFNLEPVGSLASLSHSVQVEQFRSAVQTVRLMAMEAGYRE